MRKYKKTLVTALTAAMIIGSSMTAMAAQWQQNNTGWWYQEDNGGWPASTWKWINGRCYYFDGNGYMLENTTTPDGYTVDGSGAWTVNGVVQTQEQTSASNHWWGAYKAGPKQIITVTNVDNNGVTILFKSFQGNGWLIQTLNLTYTNAEKTQASVSNGSEEEIYTLTDTGIHVTGNGKQGTYLRQ